MADGNVMKVTIEKRSNGAASVVSFEGDKVHWLIARAIICTENDPIKFAAEILLACEELHRPSPGRPSSEEVCSAAHAYVEAVDEYLYGLVEPAK